LTPFPTRRSSDLDVSAQACAGLFLQAPRGAHDQVAVVGHAGHLGVQADLAVLAAPKAQVVAVVEELEQGLQLVIAVRATAEDVQEQVELGRGGQDQLGVLHARSFRCAWGRQGSVARYWPSRRGRQSLITR